MSKVFASSVPTCQGMGDVRINYAKTMLGEHAGEGTAQTK
jgi:hypothetical protein